MVSARAPNKGKPDLRWADLKLHDRVHVGQKFLQHKAVEAHDVLMQGHHHGATAQCCAPCDQKPHEGVGPPQTLLSTHAAPRQAGGTTHIHLRGRELAVESMHQAWRGLLEGSTQDMVARRPEIQKPCWCLASTPGLGPKAIPHVGEHATT
eukprot:343910-Lingulodinium_polyedra.AAC.1